MSVLSSAPLPVGAIGLEGFKCFSALRLEFRKLTVLTGFNGAGKSSALQPLLLLAQSYRESVQPKKLQLNGGLVKVGTAGEIAHLDQARAMSFSLKVLSETVEWDIGLRSGERTVDLRKRDTPELSATSADVLRHVAYLGAVRAGPEDSFPMPDSATQIDVGYDGRFAPYWFDQLADQPAPEGRKIDEAGETFRRQVDWWLASLFPGARANVQSSASFSRNHLEFSLSDLGEWRRPANIGYGFTYAFPIIVALLAATANQVLIIDSPESHLHPSAQSAMGRMLAYFASKGVQIIIESHSDHLLNGLRLAIKDQLMPASDAAIHFFAGATREQHGVTSPAIGQDGAIHEWPDGFFDQGEKDLARLAGWN